MSTLQERSQVWKIIRPFVLGGSAAVSATCTIQPIDMVKVRIQFQGEGTGKGINRNPISVAGKLIREEGFFRLYRGLSAAVLRQLTYGMTRLGIFRTLTNHFTPEGGRASDIDFLTRLGCSLTAGGIGAFVGTPADAALVRMQNDTILPKEQQRGYKNAIDALLRMAREEGFAGFFSGAGPTIGRGLSINVGMFTTYDPVKATLAPYLGEHTQKNRFISGAISGWCAATMSLPFDFLKTRIQRMKPDAKGVYPYSGVFDAARKIAANEGIMAFYQGYFTYVIRITPHIMFTWVFLDNYKVIFNNLGI